MPSFNFWHDQLGDEAEERLTLQVEEKVTPLHTHPKPSNLNFF